MKKFFAANLAAAAVATKFDMQLNMEFMEYVSAYNKSYLTTEEFEARKDLFATIDAEIKEHNATDSLYELGHNEFSDWTKYEKDMLKGH